MVSAGGRGALAALLVALTISGCVFSDAPAADAPLAAAHATPFREGQAAEYAVPPSDDVPHLDGALALSARWAKALEVVGAHTERPERTAHVAWFVGYRDVRTRVTYIDDAPYLTDATTSPARISGGHNTRAGPIAPVGTIDTGVLQPGEAPVTIPFPIEGRFLLAGSTGGSVNITVTSLSRTTSGFVRIAPGSRFAPDEIVISPGGSVTFLDDAGAPAQATLRSILLPMEPRSDVDLRVGAVDEGAVEIAAIMLADDGQPVGVARSSFLSDFERPSTRSDFPSFDGTFACGGAPGCADESTFPFTLAFAAPSVVLNLSVASLLPTPAIEASLETADGRALGRAQLDAEHALLALRDVPPGEIVVRLRPASGALVTYQGRLDARYELPVPPGLS